MDESHAPPQDLEAELSVLGAVMLKPELLAEIVGPEHGLRAADFYRDTHGQVFEAMVALGDRGTAIDGITLKAECKRLHEDAHAALIDTASGAVPSVSHWPDYVGRVKHTARLRRVLLASHLLRTGAHTDSAAQIAEGERMLGERAETTSVTYPPRRLAEMLMSGESAPVICPWPWNRLNTLTAGGMRAAQTTFLGGWTSHGKSVAADSILAHGRKHLPRTGLYINEMSPGERMQRFAAHLAGLDLGRIQTDNITEPERANAANMLDRFAPTITDVAGWGVEEICRDIARCRWPLAAVDILHEIDYEDEGDLRRIASALNRCAKRTGCHIVATVHLNEARATGPQPPPPVLRDIRGSGMLKNSADFVLFVWQDTDEDGHPMGDARIYFSKARNGQLGGLRASFRGALQRFEPA